MDIRRILHAALAPVEEALWRVFSAPLAPWVCWDKPSAPQPPDYAAAATKTGEGNIQAAIANKLLSSVNQITPYGDLTYDITGSTTIPGIGGTPTPVAPSATAMGSTPSAVATLPTTVRGGPAGTFGSPVTPAAPSSVWQRGSPLGTPGTAAVTIPQLTSRITPNADVQKLISADLRQRLGLSTLADTATTNAQNALSTPFSLDNLPADYNQQVADALMARSARYLDPQWQTSEDAERNRLLNAGFSLGGEGYAKDMQDFFDNRTRAYATAMDTATATGVQEGVRQRQQAIAEELLRRSQPLTELASIRTGAAPVALNFLPQTGAQGIQSPDFLQAALGQYGALGNIYNAQTGTYNSQMGGLAGLGAAGILALA